MRRRRVIERCNEVVAAMFGHGRRRARVPPISNLLISNLLI
jgi:hypothetical protein